MISDAYIVSLKKAGMMQNGEPPPLVCLDANVFLALLIPEATRAPKDEIAGAERVLRAIEEGRLHGVSLENYATFIFVKTNLASRLPVLLSKPRKTCGPLPLPYHWRFMRLSFVGATIQRKTPFLTTMDSISPPV